MARAGKRVKFDLLRICRGNGAGHIARHEPVVLAVDEQHRHIRFRKRDERRAAPRARGKALFADAVGNGGG